MASSSSFSSFTELPPSASVGVTRDEFYAFHKIDRELFTRLVFVLSFDVNQSSQVIAFLFLLEQVEYARNLVAYIVSLPDAFLQAVANEIVVCLSILHNPDYLRFIVNHNNDESIIPLLIRLTGGRLTLRSIDQNRETFLTELRKNMNDICSRAFDDLCVKAERYHKEKLLALEREKVIEAMNKIRLSAQQQTPSRLNVRQGVPSRLSVQQQTPIRLSVQQGTTIVQQGTTSVQQGTPSVQQAPTTVQQAPPSVQQAPPSVQQAPPSVQQAPPSVQQERAVTPVEEETNKTTTEIEEVDDEEAVLPADDRTVFLTFSKGYPISEAEVRVYFTKRFGEVIETILMQDVEENEQPLFARMVLKTECVSKMEEIVSARNRNKFTIDGKHVWARKYVRKNLVSSASASS